MLYIQALVAWANTPLDDITTFVTVGPNVAAGQWTDISPWVYKADWARGRQHELDKFEAGTATLLVDNNDGRFSPWNTASPYNGYLLPMRYLQIRASTGNRLSTDDASFETTIGGWVANSACTVARDGTIGLDGTASLKMTATAGSAFSARSTACAVRPGATISGLASLRASAAGLHFTVGLTWLDSTGAVISTSTGASTAIPNGSFGQATVTATAPATAAAVRLLVTCTDNALNGRVLNLDEAGIFPGTVTTWAPGMTPRFTGHINTFPVRWPDNFTEWGELQASDAFRLLAFVDITSTKYAPAVLADSPIGYYRLGDPLGSTVALDSSGNGRHGTVQAQVSFGQQSCLIADVDTAADFGDSPNIGFIALPSSLVVTSGNWSCECWYQHNGTRDDTIISQDTLTPDNTGGITWLFYVDGVATLQAWLTTVGVSGFAYVHVNGVTNVQDGNPHHIVGTFTISGGNITLTVYVDGVLDATTTVVFVERRAATDTIGINGDYNGGGGGGGGIIDEVALYNVALTPSQILAHYVAGAAQWGSQPSGTRITNVADAVSFPSALRSISTGQSILQPVTSSLITTKGLAHMQQVEATEDGALYIDRFGKLIFLDRNTIATGNYAAAAFTLGDLSVPAGSSAELPFDPGPDMALDDLDLYNEATVQRNGGVLQTWADATSEAAYGRRTKSISGTLSAGDAESLYRAQWEVAHYKNPLFRLRSASVDLTEDSRLPDAVFGSDLMQLIAVNRHGVTGDAFTETALIEHIEEHWTPNSYKATFGLSPTQAAKYWQLGTSALGSTTALAF